MAQADIPDGDEYFARYGLTEPRLRLARPDAIVMHPQPMNRGVEIDSEVADGPQSVIRDQVRNGVAVRMAVLEAVLRPRPARRMSATASTLAARRAAGAPRHHRDRGRHDRAAQRVRSAPIRPAHPAPRSAQRATPGSFVHLRCDPRLPMRRPLSIMRAAPGGGVDRSAVQSHRRRHRSARRPGGRCDDQRARTDRQGLYAASATTTRTRHRWWRRHSADGVPRREPALRPRAHWKPLVLMGSEIPFPFRARPSRIMVPAAPAEAIACMPMLDEWGVPSRLASNAGYAGCYSGHVTELAARWLAALAPAELAEVAIYACGPTAMLAATARLARCLRAALPAIARGVHGLRGGRLRGLRGRDAHRPGTIDAARLRRRAGIRGPERLPRKSSRRAGARDSHGTPPPACCRPDHARRRHRSRRCTAGATPARLPSSRRGRARPHESAAPHPSSGRATPPSCRCPPWPRRRRRACRPTTPVHCAPPCS